MHKTSRATSSHACWVAALVVAMSLAACAPTAQQIDMDPLRFEVVGDGDDRRVETLDPAVLFEEAGTAFAAEDYDVAAQTHAVKRFSTDPSCRDFLLHAGQAAAGLTLTAARHVVLLEPFMRAGEEAQALNRCHRIGQKHVRRYV